MKEKHLRISRIENYFSMLLNKFEVCEHVFFGSQLPPSISKDWKSIILVEPAQQMDRHAYSYGSVNLYLYARPTDSTNRKDIRLLDEMEEKIDFAIHNSFDKHYCATTINWRDTGYDNARNLHYNIVNVALIIR